MLCLQGEPWLAVLQGHELDPVKQQEDQQRLLLERFQREVRVGGARSHSRPLNASVDTLGSASIVYAFA
jgi:hypothetical protein